MNPEDYLKRTRAPKPGPFLRQKVLQEAENAWRESRGRSPVARVVFSPLTTAACVLVSFLAALLISEVDQRVTASMVPKPGQTQIARERDRPDADRPLWIWDDEAFDGLAWNGFGMSSNRNRSENAEGKRGT